MRLQYYLVLLQLIIYTIGTYCASETDQCLVSTSQEPTPQPECRLQDCGAIDKNAAKNLLFVDFTILYNPSEFCKKYEKKEQELKEKLPSGVEFTCKQDNLSNNAIRIGIEVKRQISFKDLVAQLGRLSFLGLSNPTEYVRPSFTWNRAIMTCGRNAQFSYIFNKMQCYCLSGFRGSPKVGRGCSKFCLAKHVCGFDFPDTRVRLPTNSKQNCNSTGTQYPMATIVCRITSSGDAEFDTDSFRRISCGETINSILEEATRPNISSRKLANYATYLQGVTANPANLNSTNVEKIVQFTDQTVRYRKGKLPESFVRPIAQVVSQLAQGYWNRTTSVSNPNLLEQKLLQKISKDLPLLCLLLSLKTEDEQFDMETSTFSLKRYNVNPNAGEDVKYSPDLEEEDGTRIPPPVSLEIPGSTIKQTLMNVSANSSTSTQQEAAFILYKNDLFFPSNQTVFNILSVNLGLNESLSSNFSEPIRIKHLNVRPIAATPVEGNSLMLNKTTYECVYWSYSSEGWDSEGCYLVQSSDQLECRCNHLTNFALLVRSENVPANAVLSIVSLVGCSLSIFGLLFTVAVMSWKKELRKFRSAKILMNLCCSLAVSYIIFIFGVSNAVGNPAGCTAVAALLHYFFLVSWCWMAVYSYEIYNALIKVFVQYHSKFMTKSSAFAYLTPVPIVSLALGISYGTAVYPDPDPQLSDSDAASSYPFYNYHAETVCLIRGVSLYAAFLLPIALLLAYNLIVFVMVTYELWKQNKNMTDLRRTTVDSMIIAVTMTFVMGLTWIFGFMMLFSHDETYFTVMSWFFAITNTFQGFSIFLLTSVRREDMRNAWWEPIKKIFKFRGKDSLSKEQDSYTSSTPVTQSNGKKGKAKATSSNQFSLTDVKDSSIAY